VDVMCQAGDGRVDPCPNAANVYGMVLKVFKHTLSNGIQACGCDQCVEVAELTHKLGQSTLTLGPNHR
jgi:hypothetical protein